LRNIITAPLSNYNHKQSLSFSCAVPSGNTWL